MSDKIEEIKARHELVGGSGSVIHPTGFIWTIPGWVAHADRATLLAEVDRQSAENEKLREALEGIRIDGPDADGLVWATIQHPSIAIRSHVMVGSMDRLVSQGLIEFEQMRRKVLEGKP